MLIGNKQGRMGQQGYYTAGFWEVWSASLRGQGYNLDVICARNFTTLCILSLLRWAGPAQATDKLDGEYTGRLPGPEPW